MAEAVRQGKTPKGKTYAMRLAILEATIDRHGQIQSLNTQSMADDLADVFEKAIQAGLRAEEQEEA